MTALLTAIKLALGVTTNDFDSELTRLVNACLVDLGFAGISLETIGSQYLQNSAIVDAIITYCKMKFGNVEPQAYSRLKDSYDEQKKQMGMASGYTVFEVGGGNEQA